jgi:hypothetical protein
MTFEMAAFHSCLTVARCTTILVRIKHTPATKNIESSPDMKQTPNQSRAGGSFSVPSKSCDNFALES